MESTRCLPCKEKTFLLLYFIFFKWQQNHFEPGTVSSRRDRKINLLVTILECRQQEVTTHRRKEAEQPSWTASAHWAPSLRRDARCGGATDTSRDISPPTQTPQIFISLSLSLSKRSVEVGMVRSLIRGGGWGREAGGVEGEEEEEGVGGVSGEIWEIPEALVQRRQDLKLLRWLYLYSFLCHLLTDPRGCVNSSAPWEDSEADNETTLCVPVACARTVPHRTDGILQGMWGTKANTRVASCVWTTPRGSKCGCPPTGSWLVLSFPSCLFIVFAGSFSY